MVYPGEVYPGSREVYQGLQGLPPSSMALYMIAIGPCMALMALYGPNGPVWPYVPGMALCTRDSPMYPEVPGGTRRYPDGPRYPEVPGWP